MNWTKRHSQNAVAAKARQRKLRAEAKLTAHAGYVPHPRPTADFVITIRARTGERTQISATRWQQQFLTGDGIKSARQISRGIEMLLRHLAL